MLIAVMLGIFFFFATKSVKMERFGLTVTQLSVVNKVVQDCQGSHRGSFLEDQEATSQGGGKGFSCCAHFTRCRP